MSRYPCFWKVAGLFLLSFLQGSASPTQYYAQVYTEILGRTPTPAEWVANEYRFTTDSIDVENVRSVVVSLLQSTEFTRLGYTPTEQAFVLYRSILLREPSSFELTSTASQLGGNASIATVASNMMNSVEFRDLLLGPVRSVRQHAFVKSAPTERSVIGTGGLGNVTGAQLQAALDAAAPGETVFLSRGALVRAHQTIVIPSGVTLATYEGNAEEGIFSNRRAYAAMGRVVRSAMFAKPLIELMPGSRLMGVWVDGRRSQLRQNDPTLRDLTLSRAERFVDSHNVLLRGGEGPHQVTHLAYCKISDSAGWTGVHSVGADGGLAVGYARIANNLISSYSANRDLAESMFTDGISNASSDAIIVNNDIVDPSDVGIVIFNPGMVTGQRSQVVGNDILFAGIEGWGGITMDHSVKIKDMCAGMDSNGVFDCFDVGNLAVTADFSGTLISENLIWSSDAKYVNVGISMGVHLWGLRMFGIGGQVIGNKLGTATQPLKTGVGMVVAGIREPVVIDNVLNLKLDQNYISCFSTNMLLDPLSTTLSSNESLLQEGFVTGEAWSMLRPRSNGFIIGEFELQSDSGTQGEVVQRDGSLRLLGGNDSQSTNRWTILHSERDFGDGKRYYLIKNRATHLVIESVEDHAEVHSFSGADSQYWRIEPFDGVSFGLGIRFVNRLSEQNLGRDDTGNIIVSEVGLSDAFRWKLEPIEQRPLDLEQPSLMFLDPLGEVFQVYLESERILDHRSLGNPGVALGVDLHDADQVGYRPLGVLDFNRDGLLDAAYLRPDGGLYVTFLTENGYTTGGNIGNMRAGETFGWDINPKPNSWEKPVGFMDMGNSTTEDLIVIDREGNFEVGFITENGLANSKKLGSAASLGLTGATSDADSPIKSIGSGDFDGDGKRELLFVGPSGGLFVIKASGGVLQNAVSVGNPLEKYGFGVTSSSASFYRPVALDDINGDRCDDLVMVAPDGALLVILIKNGSLNGVRNLGNPQKSWEWNLSSVSTYSRPISIPYGRGWWVW